MVRFSNIDHLIKIYKHLDFDHLEIEETTVVPDLLDPVEIEPVYVKLVDLLPEIGPVKFVHVSKQG